MWRWRKLPGGAVVERKTRGDLASCIGVGRDRFERELKRGRSCGRMIVVVEGTLSDVVVTGRRMHHNAVVGTLAAWSLRYCPFVFAGSERMAADSALPWQPGAGNPTRRMATKFQSRSKGIQRTVGAWAPGFLSFAACLARIKRLLRVRSKRHGPPHRF